MPRTPFRTASPSHRAHNAPSRPPRQRSARHPTAAARPQRWLNSLGRSARVVMSEAAGPTASAIIVAVALAHTPQPSRHGRAALRHLGCCWKAGSARVPITHGQWFAHWQRDPAGRLGINLADTWTEFEQSVDHLIGYLRANAERRSSALTRWREAVWDAAPFRSVANASASVSATSATTTSSHCVASAISLPWAKAPRGLTPP